MRKNREVVAPVLHLIDDCSEMFFTNLYKLYFKTTACNAGSGVVLRTVRRWFDDFKVKEYHLARNSTERNMRCTCHSYLGIVKIKARIKI